MSGRSATTVSRGDAGVKSSQRLMHNVTRQDTATVRGNPLALMSAGVREVVESHDAKSQSSPNAPVIISKDLKSEHGDQVTISMLHKATGKPIMGDAKYEGTEEGLGESEFKMQIDMTAKLLYEGSIRSQQNRGYSLNQAADRALSEYWRDLCRETMRYHLAGARGTYFDDDLILDPGEPEFDGLEPMTKEAEIYVNPLRPPTFNRHYYAGDASAIEAVGGAPGIQPTDLFTLDSIAQMATDMEESAYPLQACDFSTPAKVHAEPFYVFFASPRMYADLEAAEPDFRNLQAAAMKRANGFDHNVFKSECFMFRNILVVKDYLAVQWLPGDTMKVSRNDRAASVDEVVVPGNVKAIHRGVLLGGQALAMALAGDSDGKVFKKVRKKYDMDTKERCMLRWMGGMAKIRQSTPSGRKYDTGVAVMDCAVTKAAGTFEEGLQ